MPQPIDGKTPPTPPPKVDTQKAQCQQILTLIAIVAIGTVGSVGIVTGLHLTLTTSLFIPGIIMTLGSGMVVLALFIKIGQRLERQSIARDRKVAETLKLLAHKAPQK